MTDEIHQRGFRGDLTGATETAVAHPGTASRVHRATAHAFSGRLQRAAEDPRWEALRARAAQLKRHTLANLDRYLEQFAAQVTAAGGQVHVAADAAEACAIITGLCRDHGASRVVKGKSMTSEEVGLNAALAAAGITPVEGDLGEFIVQLAEEPPSHITAPSIHRNARDTAELFAAHGVIPEVPEALRGDGPLDPDVLEREARELSLAARRFLQQDFHAAPVGITGANFLVAETGTVALVENEGNIRYATSASAAHIALAGIEKVIPRMADLGTMLSLLAPSSTAQKQTAYVSLISRPLTALHVVLLDNGRVSTLATGERSDVLGCIRCGACLNVCPVYRNVSGHAYGGPYPGPIGKTVMPHLGADGKTRFGELPYYSSLCGACEDACPVKIPIPRRILDWRAQLHEEGADGPWRRLLMKAFGIAATRPWMFRLLAWGYRTFPGLARLDPAGRAWLKTRELPEPPAQSFRQWWAERSSE
ncbi:MAG: LUD domain-containing protein [Planctomycetota bacterium]